MAANAQVVLHLQKADGLLHRYAHPLYHAVECPGSYRQHRRRTCRKSSPRATATTYFVRVSGAAGSYTLHAYRNFPALTAGQANNGGDGARGQ